MDIIFPEYEPFTTKVIFYRIPKNASTSIYDHLGSVNIINLHQELIYKKADQNIYKNIFDPTHLKPNELKNLVLGQSINDYFSFCVVRNPWDRAVSMYKHSTGDPSKKNQLKEIYNLKGEETFDNFCLLLKERRDDEHFIGSHKQSDWFIGSTPKKVLRFENLQNDFSNMVKEMNILFVNSQLPHKNQTQHAHYSEYYNSETKKIIADVFEEDIDKFKYTFDMNCGNQSTTKGSLKI